MRKKISEKNLLIAVFSMITSLILLLNLTLFASPVRVSEKGLLYFIIALALIVLSVITYKRSVHKQ